MTLPTFADSSERHLGVGIWELLVFYSVKLPQSSLQSQPRVPNALFQGMFSTWTGSPDDLSDRRGSRHGAASHRKAKRRI